MFSHLRDLVVLQGEGTPPGTTRNSLCYKAVSYFLLGIGIHTELLLGFVYGHKASSIPGTCFQPSPLTGFGTLAPRRFLGVCSLAFSRFSRQDRERKYPFDKL